MLFLQFVQYLSSFVGTPKIEIPGAALELCQLKIKQFSQVILKFSTKHEDYSFTLNCYMVPCTFLFIFHAGSRRLGCNNLRNSSYKEKTAGSARVSRLSFRCLLLWSNKSICYKSKANPWQIEDALIIFITFLNSGSISIWSFKNSCDCLVLWNQLNVTN